MPSKKKRHSRSNRGGSVASKRTGGGHGATASGRRSTGPSLATLRRWYAIRWFIGLAALLALTPTAIVDSAAALSSMFNYPATWLPETMPVRRDYEEFRSLYRGDEIIQISWDGAVLGAPELAAARDALRPFTESSPDRPAYFDEVITGQEILDRMMSPPSNFSLKSAKSRLKDAVIGPDGQRTFVLGSFTQDGMRHRRESLPRMRQLVAEAVGKRPEEVIIVGGSVDGAMVDEEAFRSIQRFTVPSFVVGAAICVICLRSILLTAAVLSVALIGQGCSLAAVAWAQLDMNAILIVLPPLVFVLTASAGIHLSNYYLDNMAEDPNQDPTAATRDAMAAGYMPCVLAASTTIVGLGSLGLVRLWPVAAFGTIAAGIVFLTLVLLLLILPGTMQWHGSIWQRRRRARVRSKSRDAPFITRLRAAIGARWEALVSKLMTTPWPVIAVFVVVTVACGYGLPQLKTSVNVPRMFPPESRIRTDYAWFEEAIGPTVNVELIIAFAADQVPDTFERFLLLREIDQSIRELDLVKGVLSPRSFLPAPPRRTSRSVGATAVKAAIRSQIESEESQLLRTGYLATDRVGRQHWRISFRFPFDESIDYRAAIDDVRAQLDPAIEQITGGNARATYTGGVPLTTSSQDVLLKDLFRSFLTAFLIVGVMMVLVLRSVAGGLLAMFPNLFPTITLFGSMGLAQVPLDIGSVMTASVALGIAVDGTVHFLSRFRRSLREDGDQHRAVMTAVRHCGPAMWQTTAVCAISPLVYGLSEFLPTQRFAIMMLGLLIAALIGDVLLLPALLASRMGRVLRRG
ncbi:MAG: MMPL family transporter [Planctomycetota bacterium]